MRVALYLCDCGPQWPPLIVGFVGADDTDTACHPLPPAPVLSFVSTKFCQHNSEAIRILAQYRRKYGDKLNLRPEHNGRRGLQQPPAHGPTAPQALQTTAPPAAHRPSETRASSAQRPEGRGGRGGNVEFRDGDGAGGVQAGGALLRQTRGASVEAEGGVGRAQEVGLPHQRAEAGKDAAAAAHYEVNGVGLLLEEASIVVPPRVYNKNAGTAQRSEVELRLAPERLARALRCGREIPVGRRSTSAAATLGAG